MMRAVNVAVVAVVVVVVAVSNGHPNPVPHTHYGPQQTSYQSPQYMTKDAVCSRLLRRTRTRTVNIPFLHNAHTGVSQPINGQLEQLTSREVEQLERAGWEVRTKVLKFSQPVYVRVRVCCPWDQACLAENQPKESSPEQPCANGGSVMFEDGKLVCDCPPGFTGPLCQSATNTQRPIYQTTARYGASSPTPAVIVDLIRRADLLRQKMRGNSPMLDQRQHLINSMAASQAPAQQNNKKDWRTETETTTPTPPMLDQRQHIINSAVKAMKEYTASILKKRMMQQRMKMLCRLKKMMRARRLQMAMAQMQGGQDPRRPSFVSIRPMGPAYGAQRPAYGARGPAYAATGPAFVARGPAFVARGPVYGGQVTPAMRTPYDLDPFNSQPSLVSDPRTRLNMNRERTMMALAFYEYMKGQTNRAAIPATQTQATPIQKMGGYPGPVASPPVRRNQFMARPNPAMEMPTQNAPDPSAQLQPRDPISTNVVQQESYQGMTMQMPNQIPNQVPSQISAEVPSQISSQIPNQIPNEVPNDLPSQVQNHIPTMPQAPSAVPPMPQGPDMPNMPNAPNMPQMPQGPDMQGRPQMPTEEQMKKMQQCKPHLEEGINECLANPDFGGLTIKMFMNPDFMNQAKKVCERSEVMGACLMRQDNACGEQERELARHMIASVMQMMGMVCQQIMSGAVPGAPGQMPPTASLTGRAEPPAPPQDAGLPYKGSTKLPTLSPSNGLPTPLDSTQDTDIPALPPTEDPEHPKFTSTKSDKPQATPTQPSALPTALGQSHPSPSPSLGHDEALPVSHRNLIFGHPAWLVIALGVVLLLVVVLSILVCCLCVRRRKQKSMMVKEIERLPVPVDGKRLSIIGVPPPLYTTATVNQTCSVVDDLSLPPIDLDYDTDAEDEKPPLDTEDDADDESDEKSEGSHGSPVAPPRGKKGGSS